MLIFLNGEGNGKPFLGIIPFPDEPPRSEVSNMLLGKSGEMNERRSWAKAEMTLSCLAQARLQPSALHIFQPHASLLEEPRFQDSGLGWGRQLMEPNLFLLLLLLVQVLPPFSLMPAATVGVKMVLTTGGQPLTMALCPYAAHDSGKCLWVFK